MNKNVQTTGICGMPLRGTTYTLWAFQKKRQNDYMEKWWLKTSLIGKENSQSSPRSTERPIQG